MNLQLTLLFGSMIAKGFESADFRERGGCICSLC